MPTTEEILTDIAVDVSQVASDVAAIGVASTTNSGLVQLSDENTPDDNSIPTIGFFKNRNILGAGGEAGAGLPQGQIDQINSLPPEAVLSALAALPAAQIGALPAEQILTALGALPASLNGLEGQVIAVNATGDGYELVIAPAGGGGGGGATVNIVVDHFTGDNSTTLFTLSQAAADSNTLDIAVSGVSIDPANYTVAGTNLTFLVAPPVTSTDEIVVRHFGNIAILDDDSVTTIKIAANAVTLAKMANGTPGKFLKFNDSTGVIEEADAGVSDNSISTIKIIDKNITLTKLADGTPGKSLKYNESTGVVEETDVIVPDNAVTLAKIANGTPGKSLKFNDSTGVIEETDVIAPDNSIGTAKVIDKNITLAKLADGTPGKLLKYNDSTGVIEEVSIGTLSGAWQPVSKTEITTSVVSVDIPIGTDAVYQVRYRRLRNNVHDKGLFLRLGVGGVFTSEIYNWGYMFARGSGMTREVGGSANDPLGIRVVHRLPDNGVLDTAQGFITLDSPAETAQRKTVRFEWNGVNEDSTTVLGYGSGYRQDSSAAVDTLRFEAEAGSTLESGIFDLYKLITL